MNEQSQEKKFMDISLPLEERIEDLLSKITLEEKFNMISGHTGFTTYPIPRLNLPEFGMTDGPHGVGAHSSETKRNTYFPAAIGLAASWNIEMAEKFGQALAEETRAAGRHAILAPGFNICRTPLNGRTFEYLSEDPYFNGEMAASIVKGIQSRRVAACIKHFVCNNQESYRRFSNSIVDERTLEEIYFKAFKKVIQTANPWMMMGSYNQLNGKYVYENPELLADKVCKEWGFNNLIVTDWFASHYIRDPSLCIKSKLSLEMPKKYAYRLDALNESYEKKKFSDEDLDDCIRRLLRTMLNVGLCDPKDKIPEGSRNTDEHRIIAQKMAEESFVLLKNEEDILPIDINKFKRVFLTGEMKNYHFAPRVYGGSSGVMPNRFITIEKALKEKWGDKVVFVKNSESADIVLIATGWTHRFFKDSEGQDRKTLKLSKRKIKRINKNAAINKNTVVLLFGGAPCGMEDWIDNISGLLVLWQPHQEVGYAIWNILSGAVNPSGKLPVTFPKYLKDSPAHLPKYPKEKTFIGLKYNSYKNFLYEVWHIKHSYEKKIKIRDIQYEEGIFVGYRHFDTNNIKPRYPFGFGLSYSQFEYHNIKCDKQKVSENDVITISVDISNKSDYDGKEIVQIYYKELNPTVKRPEKELCGFTKEFIKANETKTIKIGIDINEFGFYNTKQHSWDINSGKYEILIGKSSREIIETLKINLDF